MKPPFKPTAARNHMNLRHDLRSPLTTKPFSIPFTRPISARGAAFLAALGICVISAQAAPVFNLDIIHVNDTHSHFDPAQTKLTLDLDDQMKAKAVYVEMGGFAQAADVIKQLRSTKKHPLVLHGGDFFQGSLYFTKFEGEADIALWNLVGLDAATLGNHEFDKGVPLIKDRLLGAAKFPIVSANVDFSKEPALKGIAPKPFVIKRIGGTKVGIIGATTLETPNISSPGKNITFHDPVGPVQKAVQDLTRRGVNKIVLVSHLGYQADLDLATKVSGVDVIVGGHSHTLLGNWKAEGLGAAGAYPTTVKDKTGNTVVVVQAWEWAKMVGDLQVSFDTKGHVTSFQDAPVAVVGTNWFRIYDVPNTAGELKRVQFLRGDGGVEVKEYDGKTYVPVSDETKNTYLVTFAKLEKALGARKEIALTAGDPQAKTLIAKYSAGVKEMQQQVAAQVGTDLKRGLNMGPGPIIADSMRAKTGTQIAISNSGGIRTDLLQGPLTVAQVYEVIPFGNTLVILKAKGSEVVKTLEDGCDFSWNKSGHDFPANPLLYVSGLTFAANMANEKGNRISEVQVLQADGGYQPIQPDDTYTIAVNNFMATGGDLYATLKNIPNQTDTGFIDAEALLEYVKGKTLEATEERIRIVR